MRQKNREIKDINKIAEVIDSCEVCRIAINDEEYPYIVPLNFGYEMKDNIILYFHSALEGKKIDLLKKNNKVCFEMDTVHELYSEESRGYCTFRYKSVIGTGEIHFIEDEKEKEHALQKIMDHYHMEDFPWSRAAMPRTAVYKLEVRSITGKEKN